MTLEEHAEAAARGERASLEAVVLAIQDDIYGLCMRMLGNPADAGDATQEILIKVITQIGSFRGESALRTWVWTIATRHVVRMRRTRYETATDFPRLEVLIDEGAASAGGEPVLESDVAKLSEEIRLGCTHAMLVALDREHRIAYTLGDIFGIDSEQASAILAIDSATFRKRLQRARDRLGAFMKRKCGIVNPVAACQCVRQIPMLLERGLLDPARLIYSDHPRARPSDAALTRAWGELSELDGVARTMRERPEYAAPDTVIRALRTLLDSKRFELLQ